MDGESRVCVVWRFGCTDCWSGTGVPPVWRFGIEFTAGTPVPRVLAAGRRLIPTAG